MAEADSVDDRISPGCPVEVQAILRASWRHDTAALKPLLDAPGKASCRDPVTGETPLHAAIRGAGPVEEGGAEGAEGAGDGADLASKTVDMLLFRGAIWNDVDDHNETPGCVAWRLRQLRLYDQMVRAGMRAEMLFAVLDGYEALGSEGEDEEEGEDEQAKEEEEEEGEEEEEADKNEEETTDEVEASGHAAQDADQDTSYLESHLTLGDGRLVDAAGNGVMMAWETEIMRRSVDAMLGSASAGKRVLNIGFGLGIIDSLLAARRPARHHIIEAHPEVLARIDGAAEGGGSTTTVEGDHAAAFGAAWAAAGPEPGAFCVHRGRWQDVVPRLLAAGELYDAVYFDTFGEDYAELRRFFTDYVPGLLDDGGVFGFFHGLGADRRVCYDVYTRVVELHLAEAGLDVEWHDVDVPLARDGLDTAGQGAWQGILRPYWTLEKYRLPVCTFMG